MRLSFDLNIYPCPGTETLNEEPIIIAVFLVDTFSTPVTGSLVEQNPLFILMTPIGNSTNVQTLNNTNAIDPQKGSAFFNDTIFYGINNSTVLLKFNISESHFYQHFSTSIETTSCSVLLYGCEEGYQIQSSSDSEFDVCVETHQFSLNTLLAMTFLFFSFSLFCVLVVVLFSFCFRCSKKKIKRKRLLALEIPDFSINRDKPFTLDDILEDSTIPRLDWNNVLISDVIGKGASGLVSKGIWKQSNKNEKQIALKELVFGFQDFGMEVLDEFFIEIKFMR